MCGIAAIFSDQKAHDYGMIEHMVGKIKHRGPDGIGYYRSQDKRCSLGHARLSIIDVENGKQPLSDPEDRYHISFNGELYNYEHERNELKKLGYKFKTKSDTEVVLAFCVINGIDKIYKLDGIFAFVIYDSFKHELFIARDRLGVKPLYYAYDNGTIIIGSEIKAILSIYSKSQKINKKALIDFVQLSYCIGPDTFYSDIFELQGGHYAHCKNGKLETQKYYSYSSDNSLYDFNDATEMAFCTIKKSLQKQVVSDVPIGAFLSAGLDSSLLVATVAKELNVKIKTFTASFNETAYNEGPLANKLANELGTEHHDLKIDGKIINPETCEMIMDQFDQPFGDSSAIPCYFISQEVSKFVKVCIGGDGGDEMFGGYTRFHYAKLCDILDILPRQLPDIFQKWFGSILSNDKNRQLNRLSRALKETANGRLLHLSNYVSKDETLNILNNKITQNLKEYTTNLLRNNYPEKSSIKSFINSTINVALPNDYLKKIDITSTAHGLEVRVPFLGNDVVDLSSKLHPRLLGNIIKNKPILRMLGKKHLPNYITNRKKSGFGVPIDKIFSKTSKKIICDDISKNKSNIYEIFEPSYINNCINGFLHNERNSKQQSRVNAYQRFYMVWNINNWLKKSKIVS